MGSTRWRVLHQHNAAEVRGLRCPTDIRRVLINPIVGRFGGSAASPAGTIVPPMGGPDNDTDLLRRLEDLVPGSEVWEIARRYRIHRYRYSDAKRQTVEVEIMFNHDIGWRVVATDSANNISASGPPHPDLNVVLATVRWQDLDDQAVPPPRSSDT